MEPATLDAIAHPTRLAMLAACSAGPHTAAQLADTLNITDTTAREHLDALTAARLLQRRGGAYTAPADWRPIIAALEALQPR